MRSFSVSDAIFAGFRLVAREPGAVLVWAMTYILVATIPRLVIMHAVLPNLIGLYLGEARMVMGRGGGYDLDALRELGRHTRGLSPLLFILSVVTQSVLVGAIYRAVLKPEDRGFFYLRLSRQELWLGLSGLTLWVMTVVLCIVILIPISIVAVTTSHALRADGGGPGVTGLAVGAVVVAGLIAALWAGLRLAMGMVISFAEGRFALLEGWRLTEGQSGKLLAVFGAVLLLTILLEIVVFALGLGAGLIVAGASWREILTESPERLLQELAPAMLAYVAVAAVFGMAVLTIMAAPWAMIYREIVGEPAATA